MRYRILFCCWLFLHFFQSHADTEIEIGGLLLDRSLSRSGHEFYAKFSLLWQDVPNTSGINVVIKETVMPRAGTRLVLEMNNQVIYATYLGRRIESVEDKVEQAIFTTIDAIARSQFTEQSDDLASSGW
ncbi:curli production assembly protein CsgE [Pseudoalteromonas tunicata]|nr:curli production assembly protein CsgE [Pseudoalteromonas tunicata]